MAGMASPARVDLENVFWRAFTGSQAHLTAGTATIRRYARGLPPIIAYPDPGAPDFAAIRPFVDAGERFYCCYWRGPCPTGWTIEVETAMCGMVWDGRAAPPAATDAKPLGLEHVEQMMALAALTRPGPYPSRPMDIGEWWGLLEGDRLVAMAGERAHDGDLREVSGVCTVPDRQGRGFARALTSHVVRSQLERGFTPFLHVASANVRARELYAHMGFAHEREEPLRIVSALG